MDLSMAFFFMSTRSQGSELPTGALVVCLDPKSSAALATAEGQTNHGLFFDDG
jgi:hypothetical protein